jgi:hypothetical protein
MAEPFYPQSEEYGERPDISFFRKLAARVKGGLSAFAGPGTAEALPGVAGDAARSAFQALGRTGAIGPWAPEEPIGDFARRQGMVETPDPAIERGAQQQLAASLSPQPAKPEPTAESLGLPASWSRPFEQPATNAVETAGPPTSQIEGAPKSHIRYKDASGNWKDFAVNDQLTGNRPGGPGGVEPAQAYDPTQQRVETYRPASRMLGPDSGAGFTPSGDVEKMPLGQRPPSYFADKELERSMAENEQKRVLAETLTEDPFAKERTLGDIGFQRSVGIEGAKSRMRQGEEAARTEGYLGASNTLTAQKDAELAKVAHLPETDPRRLATEAKIERIYDDEINRLREGYGFGARLGQAVRQP